MYENTEEEDLESLKYLGVDHKRMTRIILMLGQDGHRY